MLANQAQYFSVFTNISQASFHTPEWRGSWILLNEKKMKLLNETISSTNNDTFEYLPAGAFLPISSAIYVFQELVSHDQ